jgi:hypothetical protein
MSQTARSQRSNHLSPWRHGASYPSIISQAAQDIIDANSLLWPFARPPCHPSPVTYETVKQCWCMCKQQQQGLINQFNSR